MDSAQTDIERDKDKQTFKRKNYNFMCGSLGSQYTWEQMESTQTDVDRDKDKQTPGEDRQQPRIQR